jgi:hypothetical protein
LAAPASPFAPAVTSAFPEAAAALMKPANEDVLTERVVFKAVGNVRNNGPKLLN